VIEVGTAFGAVEDTGTVHLEDRPVSFDENGGWLLCNGCLHLGDIVASNISVVSDLDFSCLSDGVLASSIYALVSIGVFGLCLEVFPVSEGLVLPATATSVVSIASCLGSTIDELLLGEGDKVAISDEMLTFKCSCGGESPA